MYVVCTTYLYILFLFIHIPPHRKALSWDSDMGQLAGMTIQLLRNDHLMSKELSHNFVRKTFFTLVLCDSCRRLLFQVCVCLSVCECVCMCVCVCVCICVCMYPVCMYDTGYLCMSVCLSDSCICLLF